MAHEELVPSSVGLVIFDLDGTLLRGRTVCEVIADRIGRGRRMREMESLTDRAAIALARREMAGWYVDKEQADLVACLEEADIAPGVAGGIALLKAHGFALAIASITWEFAVREFARRWGIGDILGTGLGDDGELAHVWPEDKAEFLRRLVERHHLQRMRTHAVGDSTGDLPMLRAAGNGYFVGRIAPPPIEGLRHCPEANIHAIAQEIVFGERRAA